MVAHDCFEGETSFESTDLLETTHWEFTIEKCLSCGQRYLRAFMETQGYSASGKWVMGAVGPDFMRADPEEQALLALLHGLPRLLYGGSHWGHGGRWAQKSPPNSPIYQILAFDIWDPNFKSLT